MERLMIGAVDCVTLVGGVANEKAEGFLFLFAALQDELTSQWEEEKGELTLIQTLKEEVERVGIEVRRPMTNHANQIRPLNHTT
eukprot:1190479-Prorocentrum_minimum.AAC.5